MAYGICVLTLGCLLLSSSFVSACPPENIVRPCSCDHSSLVCEGITEQGILDGVFRRLGNVHLEEFMLVNSQVSHLISSTASKNSFQRLRIINSILVDLFDQVPSTQNQLSQLRLENATIQNGFHVKYLKPLQQLELLIITHTVVPKLGKEFSMSLSEKIKVVSLWQTKTVSIDDAFVGKSKLESVHIQNASLTSIKRFSFPYPSTNLWRLTFDGNQIESLDQDQFTYMSGLRVVSLAGNKISQVSEEVFGEVYDQLTVLNLNGNPIKCDCSIHWLTRRSSRSKDVQGECVEPQALAGKKIVDLKPSDFASCPSKSERIQYQ